MAKSNPSTISLKAPGVRDEGAASEAITPGHLVEFGGSNDYQKHGSAGGDAMPTFALENDVVGDDIDTDYATSEQMQVETFHSGAEVYAWLAGGENVSKGVFLESAGDGTLQQVGTASSSGANAPVIAQALEAVNISGTSVGQRIKVRIR